MFSTKFCKSPFRKITRNMASKFSNSVLISKIGEITTIGINRPEKRNCLDLNTATQIRNAIMEFEDDVSSSAAVLYGTGGNFCSGFDMKEIAELESNPEVEQLLEMGLMGKSVKYVKKPVVAAINGYAVAGGLELALMCDLRVMEETAVIGLYGRRFGIPLADGAIARLQAMIGLSRALDIILTGRSLNAKEALEWGVANRIVACGTALGQAINLATSLVKFPQECLHMDRDSTYNAAYNKVFNELSKYEQKSNKNVLVTEAIEGAKKFLSGIGRHGKAYNLTEKDICEWEKEFSEDNKIIKPKSKL